MLFADKIRSLREEKKMLQRELAAALSVDTPMYSRIERGERPIKREQIKILADLFCGILPSMLSTGVPQETTRGSGYS